ncbi:hypothetical protein ELS19_00035 [Halogeometricum borinquense]|uniref:Uncharacterized protein n=1 Tax=Halogeometricum borinquense TaxID=60847 RepID=A0A482TG61_9EURY|nr:hypothetical protein ELS19_00035 [Halogeometricum borinquense]
MIRPNEVIVNTRTRKHHVRSAKHRGTALSRLNDRDLVRHKGGFWAIADDDHCVTAAYDLLTTSDRLDNENSGLTSTSGMLQPEATASERVVRAA